MRLSEVLDGLALIVGGASLFAMVVILAYEHRLQREEWAAQCAKAGGVRAEVNGQRVCIAPNSILLRKGK